MFPHIPYYFDYCSFIVLFEVRKCDTSSFVNLSQDYFSYLGSFVVTYKFLKTFIHVKWVKRVKRYKTCSYKISHGYVMDSMVSITNDTVLHT